VTTVVTNPIGTGCASQRSTSSFLSELLRISAGQLNGAIEALSNLELSGTAVALGRTRKDLEDEGNYESAAVAGLVRDRVADEQKMRAAEN